MPAKVAVVAVASVGSVAAGAPIVATISDAGAQEAPATTTQPEPGDDVVVTTVPATTESPSTEPPATSTPGVDTTTPPTATTTTTEAPPERLELWCDRVSENDRRHVVCEWAASRHDAFVAYVVVRDGERVATIDDRTVGDRSGIRWVDEDAPEGSSLYVVHIVDAEGAVIGASNSVLVNEPPATTTTTTTEEISETTEPAPTTTQPKVEEEEIEPVWESIGIWCGRSEGESGVVCEFGISEREDFGAYVLKRNGEPIWDYGSRTIPGRPWPDIRYVDAAAPAGEVSYAAYIVDTAGNWVGGSGTMTLESTIEKEAPEEEEEEEEEETPWESLGLWCGRSEGAETPTVVCEFTSSESETFGFYVLKRNGTPLLESGEQGNAHFYDYAAPTEEVTYTVYVLDGDNNWTGSSNTVTIPAVASEGEGEGE